MIHDLKLRHELLDTEHDFIDMNSNELADLNVRGRYSSMQFVIRLTPKIHDLISSVPNGIYGAHELTDEVLQAFSTYLHETIHWWQHVGSTSGLIYSLSYPAQSHSNHMNLKAFVRDVGAKKSIKTWARDASLNGITADNPMIRGANTVVNNVMDLEFYKNFAFKPSSGEKLYENIYFESCPGSAPIGQNA